MSVEDDETFFLPNFPDTVTNPTDDFISIEQGFEPNALYPNGILLSDLNYPPGTTSGSGGIGFLLPSDLEFGTTTFVYKARITEFFSGDFIHEEICEILVVVGPAGSLDGLISLPVRPCIVDGTIQAMGATVEDDDSPGDVKVPGEKVLDVLRVASDLWLEQARILFRPASAPDGIPVIRDPVVNNSPGAQLGDIDFSSSSASDDEVNLAAYACEQAWNNAYPDQRGIPLINARDLRANGFAGQALGLATSPDKGLWVEQVNSPLTGKRGDDLCGQPRNLLVDDVSEQWVIVIDPQTYQRSHNRPAALAHELGHTLLLGHGNGFDDDLNGLLPPDPGPRRFDQYCDPAGNDAATLRPNEELGLSFNCGEDMDSLMRPSISGSGCPVIRPLQAEQGRAAAKLHPGAVFDASEDPAGALISAPSCAEPPCGSSADLFLTKLQFSITPGLEIVSLLHKVLAPIPSDVNARYAAFVDLDTSEQTGCSPSDLGFSTAFSGAELVTEVVLTPGTESPVVGSTVWRCDSGQFLPVTNPAIQAFTANPVNAETEAPLSGIVAVRMPALVAGSVGDNVRLQGIAQDITSGEIVRIPDDAAQGGIISLIPPDLPECEVTPPFISPGGPANVQLTGLLSNADVSVLLGAHEVGSGSTDAAGSGDIDFFIPAVASAGSRAVSVRVEGSATSAVCAMVVVGSALTPMTNAETVPAPNLAGWHNSNFTLLLQATPASAPISSITYSASGAQTIPSQSVPGDTVSIPVTGEGVTTFSFFATDQDQVSEPPQSLVASVDQTPPSITGARSPAANGFGWNNEDVTVQFDCSDALSGIYFCTGPVIISTEGSDQSASGTADDLAGNSASATVAGINIDKTPPVITYEGNTSPYGLLESVQIICEASDALSGVASNTCSDIIGPAYGFDRENTFAAEASDFAGNVTVSSTSFEVIPTYDDLCELTRQFIAATNPSPRQANKLGRSLCRKLAAAEKLEAAGQLIAQANVLQAFLNQLAANTGNFFTQEQADILSRWVGEI